VQLVDRLEFWDVNWLQLERQESANSVIAILVGAALVATVTFGCLLQPPSWDSDAASTFDQWVNQVLFLVTTTFSFTFSVVSSSLGLQQVFVPAVHL